MVALEAPSPPPDLPTLSQEDSALLHRYWSLGEDLAAIAKDTGQTLMAVLAWTLRPDVRAWIIAHHRHEDELNFRLTINTLTALVRTSEDPVEKRRAASVLLRAYTTPLPRGEGGPKGRVRGSDEDSAPNAGPSTARGQRTPAAPDEAPPTPRGLDEIDALEDREADEGPDAPGTQTAAPPEPPLILAEPPPGTPELSRDTTPEQVAARTLAALTNPTIPTPDAYQHALYNLLGRDPKARTAEALNSAAARALGRSGLIPGFLACEPGPIIVGGAGWTGGWAHQDSIVTLMTGERRRLRLTIIRGYTPAIDLCWHLRHIESTPITDQDQPPPSPAPTIAGGEGAARTVTEGPPPASPSPHTSTPTPQDSGLPAPNCGPLRLIHPTPLSIPEPARRASAAFAFQPGFGNTS